jgi:hypothetical protein
MLTCMNEQVTHTHTTVLRYFRNLPCEHNDQAQKDIAKFQDIANIAYRIQSKNTEDANRTRGF